MEDKKVVVIGGGVLGSQIAFQAAYSGYDVIILIREEDNKDLVIEKLNRLNQTYIDTINKMNTKEGKEPGNWARGISKIEDFDVNKCLENVNKTKEKLRIETNQEIALKDAYIVIESITEDYDIKTSLYKEISNKMDEKTILVTNSSTLLPSKLAKSTGRASKFLAMHFANSIWKNNIAEIMGHDDTLEEYFNEVVTFALNINMIPLAVKEEKSGYLLNSLLVPFLLSAMDLLANGISTPEMIDKAWVLGTGAPKGPFQIIDTVGLETARNIVLQYQKVPNIFDPLLKKMMLPYNYDGMLRILNEYIDAGKLGLSTKEGFYKYK